MKLRLWGLGVLALGSTSWLGLGLGGCGPSATHECTVDQDCKADDDPCTLAVCTLQESSSFCDQMVQPGPGCACTEDAECDDGNKCTADTCDATGTCIHPSTPECCNVNAVCDRDPETGVLSESCTCVDCLSDPVCSGCNGDGSCDVAIENCDCADCFSDPTCAPTCNRDTMCDPEEDCTCADCAPTPGCGGDCEAFTVPSFAPMMLNSAEELTSNVDGPLEDTFQVFFQQGIMPGTFELTPVALASECFGTTTSCPMVVTENFGGKRYRHVSGTLVIDSVSPLAGRFENVRLENTMQVADDVTYIPDDCLFLALLVFPTP